MCDFSALSLKTLANGDVLSKSDPRCGTCGTSSAVSNRERMPKGPFRTKNAAVLAHRNRSDFRDAEMTIKIIFERSSQKGGLQRVRKEGQQGTHLEILLSA